MSAKQEDDSIAQIVGRGRLEWDEKGHHMRFITVVLFGSFFLSGCLGAKESTQVERRWSGNPIIKHDRTADPAVLMAPDGKTLWMYTSHDQDDAVDYDSMDGYRLYSTTNLVDWTDHGEILHSSQLDWGKPGVMCAPCAAYKDGTYFFYFPHQTTNSEWRVGIATSPAPEGPYTPHPQQYVTGPGMEGGFDPMVFMDDDGAAYLYWGSRWDCNKAPKVARLKENMIELAEEPHDIDYGWGKHFFEEQCGEGVYMHKRGDTYYFSFSSFHGYASMGDNPYGPFTNFHQIAKADGLGAQDHHSIIELGDDWYYFYHVGDYDGGNTYRRNSSVDKLYYNDDGTIQLVQRTTNGVPEIRF